ncbi:MBL fold metallo-hydrolase [Promicromonospora sp. NPDC057138]|uniref:MBL fold metallo-hydrolase n=1 Tax=Promicromonospora sp. NPDC057138 TaxID=3346031 RepID=UPI00363B3FFB
MPQEIPDPEVRIDNAREIAEGIVVIENRGVELVPNIGVIAGADAVLVVDTGMGLRNAGSVLQYAQDVAAGRELFLTTTHFHPEHAFGAQVFAGAATYVANRAQADDLAHKGAGYLDMFRSLAPTVADRLADVVPPTPDLVYDGTYDLDLGGRVVRLLPTGQGHTLGDQVVLVPDAKALFTGDLAETAQFPIFPWFPPYDTDVSGPGWIGVLDTLLGLGADVVVPGHGDVGGPDLLRTVRDAITELRDETARLRAAGRPDDAIAGEVGEILVGRHPGWHGREWIPTAVAAFLAERGSAK